MNQHHKVIAVFLVAVMGIWGCTQGPAGGSPEKIKTLETKVNKLEEDFKTAAAARDQARKKLSETEALANQLRGEHDKIANECTDLRGQLKNRTAERDTALLHFEGFRKSLKDLIGQTEASLAKPNSAPIITVSQPKNPGS